MDGPDQESAPLTAQEREIFERSVDYLRGWPRLRRSWRLAKRAGWWFATVVLGLVPARGRRAGYSPDRWQRSQDTPVDPSLTDPHPPASMLGPFPYYSAGPHYPMMSPPFGYVSPWPRPYRYGR